MKIVFIDTGDLLSSAEAPRNLAADDLWKECP